MTVLDRVAAFLPMMAQSNTELLQRAVADPRSVIVDDPDGDDDEDEDEDEAEDEGHRAGGAGAAMQAGDEAEPEERERERRIVEMVRLITIVLQLKVRCIGHPR